MHSGDPLIYVWVGLFAVGALTSLSKSARRAAGRARPRTTYPRPQPAPAAAPPPRSRAAPAAQPAPAAEPSPYAEAAVLQEAIAPQAAGESVSAGRRLFEGRGELVRAVIAAEVLGTPIALRARERTQPLW